MTQQQGSAAIILLIFILLLNAFAVAYYYSATPKWDYHIDSIADRDLAPAMEVAGRRGWELVFARRAAEDSNGTRWRYEMIFKREAR